MRGETIFQAEKRAVPDQIGIVAANMLLVRDEKPIAIDGRGSKVEGVGLAVIPVAPGAVVVDLVLDRDVICERPFESATHPQFVGAGGIVGDIVIRLQGARVHCQWPEDRAIEGVDSGAGNDAALGIGSRKRGRHQRRAPISVPLVFLVLDGSPQLERVGQPVVQLRREVRQVLIVAIDEAVDLRLADVDMVIQPLHGRAAAGAEMGAVGP